MRNQRHDAASEGTAAQQRLASAGRNILREAELTPLPHAFFPSFMGFTYQQAREMAVLANLEIVVSGSHEEGHVQMQSPLPGSDWSHQSSTVQLRFI